MKLFIEILVGTINLLVFWGIRVGDDLYSVWGGLNESGSVYSLVGVYQSARTDASAMFALIQRAGDVAMAMIAVVQFAGRAMAGLSCFQFTKWGQCAFFSLVQAGESTHAGVSLFQCGDDKVSAVFALVQYGKEVTAWASIFQWADNEAWALVSLVQRARVKASSYLSVIQFYQNERGPGIYLIASTRTGAGQE